MTSLVRKTGKVKRSGGPRLARASRGLSITELMVAMTVGLVIMAAVGQIFVSSRTTYTLEEGLARAQEAGRFAIDLLAQEIRMAGYAGCTSQLPPSSVNNIVQLSGNTPATDAYKLLGAGIRGYRYTGNGTGTALTDWTPALPSDFFAAADKRPLARTDVLVIQHGSTLDITLSGNLKSDNANIKILETAELAGQISAGDILLLSDCSSADIFQAGNVSNSDGKKTITHPNGANTTPKLSKAYPGNAQLMKLVSRAYYIGNGANDEASLMRKDVANATLIDTQELLEGIENLRFTYGVDAGTDDVPDFYQQADAVASWDKVIDVKIGLVARTTSDVGTQINLAAKTFDGVTINFLNDKRWRQFYVAAVKIRN